MTCGLKDYNMQMNHECEEVAKVFSSLSIPFTELKSKRIVSTKTCDLRALITENPSFMGSQNLPYYL
jgi:hypothetical protein